MEKREHSCTVDGNVNRYSHYGRWYGDYFRTLEIEPPYDTSIPLLGIKPEETIIEKDICTPMFTTALFPIARIWNQSRCPSINEWIM